MVRITGHVLCLLLLSANGFIPSVLSANLTFLSSSAMSQWLSLKPCHYFSSIGCRNVSSFLCSSEACHLISLVSLGLANNVISWPLGWWYPGLIELIEYPYQQGVSSFSEAYLERTSKLSVLGLEQFGMSDRPGSFLGCAWVSTKCTQKTRVGLWGQYMILESCHE
jgi:hypothetical protein